MLSEKELLDMIRDGGFRQALLETYKFHTGRNGFPEYAKADNELAMWFSKPASTERAIIMSAIYRLCWKRDGVPCHVDARDIARLYLTSAHSIDAAVRMAAAKARFMSLEREGLLAGDAFSPMLTLAGLEYAEGCAAQMRELGIG